MINWASASSASTRSTGVNRHWGSQFAVSSIVIWRWTGYNALIYLAAMQADPARPVRVGVARRRQPLAAVPACDGPALRPTILFTVVVSTIGATQLFGEPLLFGGRNGSKGGTEHQYQTLGLYLYDQGWINGNLGRASAIAWSMFLILLIVAVDQSAVHPTPEEVPMTTSELTLPQARTKTRPRAAGAPPGRWARASSCTRAR